MKPDLSLEPFLLPARRERLKRAARTRTNNICVVLDGVHDPHNLSAVVRSCDGFGILNLHVIESQKKFSLKHKVSLGAEKWIVVQRHHTPSLAVEVLRNQGFRIWVADPRPGGSVVDDLPWDQRLALVFGNEHLGASAEILRAAEGCFTIPMYGFGESFNVSVATGISLAVGVRERLRRLGHHGDLSETEQFALVETWQRRAVRRSDKILKALAQSRRGGNEANDGT